MPRKNVFFCLVLVLVVLMESCGFENNTSAPISETEALTSLEMTGMAIIPLDPQTALSDPNYLAECKKQYHTSVKEQIGYKGIFPGETSPNAIRDILGGPQKTISFKEYGQAKEEWIYKDIALFISEGEIEGLMGEANETYDQLFGHFGCPQLIVYDIDEDPNAEAIAFTWFIYSSAGIILRDGAPPVNVNSTPWLIWYSKAYSTIKEYIEAEDIQRYPALDWKQAVTK